MTKYEFVTFKESVDRIAQAIAKALEKKDCGCVLSPDQTAPAELQPPKRSALQQDLTHKRQQAEIEKGAY